MFFNRTRPSVDALAAMLKGDVAQSPTQAQEPRGSHLRILDTKVPAAATPVQPPLIEDIKDVPQGRYAAFESLGIPRSFSECFAVLLIGETAAVLLTAAEAIGSHPQFELQRRLQVEKGIATVTLRQASREIIKTVHDAHVSIKITKNTRIEDAGWEIVEDAVAKTASDIHIETRGSYAQVFFRIFGERVEQPSIAATTATEICNVLYGVHADSDNKGISWDMKTVKDTVIGYTTKAGKSVQLRFSSAPIHPSGNFHAVIRLLVMDETTIRPVEDVGYTPGMVAAIEEMLLGSQGMVILVGPTNSGKSTSMQSFIERIYQMRGRSIKVLTVEDPVEYVMRDACQMSVPESRKGLEDGQSGSMFSTFLRGTLRQDPDVVMVGEIRDSDGAEHVKNLVLAGRKLLTTLHVYEVPAVFARLREIGVPESVLYMDGFVSGVVCQRLVPLLCPHCSIPVADALAGDRIWRATYDRVSRVADLTSDDVRVRGDGCQTCNYMGIIGRTPCAEVLVPDSTFLDLMAEGRTNEARKYWASSSPSLNVDGFGVSMIAHAIQKMRQGLIDPAHIETHIGRLLPDTAPSGSVPAPALGTEFPSSLKLA
jgi:general secretion pathway protein E